MALRIALVLFFLIGGFFSTLSFTQAADYSSFFKNDKVTSIAIKNNGEEKIDTATVTTKSGKCYMFQLQKGKVIAWKTCKDTEWKDVIK
jgi:hypothetical protein